MIPHISLDLDSELVFDKYETMNKKIITQSERTAKFNEWLITQSMPPFKNKVDRQKWWIGKVIEYDKLLYSDGWDIIPDFYIDSDD